MISSKIGKVQVAVKVPRRGGRARPEGAGEDGRRKSLLS